MKLYIDTDYLLELFKGNMDEYESVLEGIYRVGLSNIYISAFTVAKIYEELSILRGTQEFDLLHGFVSSVNIVSLTDTDILSSLSMSYGNSYKYLLEYILAGKSSDIMLVKDVNKYEGIEIKRGFVLESNIVNIE